jgi:hypothetical protein
VVTGGVVNSGNTAGATASSTATCGANTQLIGGGAFITETGNTKAALAASYPSTPGTAGTWTATSIVTTAGTGQPTIQAYAICAS